MSAFHAVRAYHTKLRSYYREYGLKKTLKAAAIHIRNNPRRALTLRGRSYQSDKRVDTEVRRELIRDHVPPSASSALDIGCNQGVFTATLAKEGLFTIGVERDEMSLLSAQNDYRFDEGVAFMKYDISPETISDLPSFDIVLLLTVYHWWWREFGWERAEDMLRELVDGSEALFFELPKKSLSHPEFSPSSEASVVDEFEEYFRYVVGDSVEVTCAEIVDYEGGDRKDLFVVLDCR